MPEYFSSTDSLELHFDCILILLDLHCVKIVGIRNFSGPYFPVFGLIIEICRVNTRIQSECRKTQTRKLRILTTFKQCRFSNVETLCFGRALDN